MLRKLALLLLPLALLAAACGGGGDSSDASSTDAPAVETDGDVYHVNPDGEVEVTSSGSAGDPFAAFFGSLNPLDPAGGLDALPPAATAEVDDDLVAALLSEADLPAAFQLFEDVGFTVEGAQMAARIFATGDPEGDDPGTMIMSMAMEMPPELWDEFLAQGGLESFDDIQDEVLSELNAPENGFGDFIQFELLEASDLGEAAFGMHMEMDLGPLFDALAELDESGELEAEGDVPFAAGIAMETFMFLRENHAYMVTVMWPLDRNAEADARDLARTMADRATP